MAPEGGASNGGYALRALIVGRRPVEQQPVEQQPVEQQPVAQHRLH
jgi:hypothetical protein